MNIFYLHTSPLLAAQMQHDKHVVKMILESAQLLCTAHHLAGTATPEMYKVTHQNHPSAVWVRESAANYNWLRAHFEALSHEYTYRYGKVHRTWANLGEVLLSPPKNDDSEHHNVTHTDPPQCMPDEFKCDDTVQAYRNYYKNAKVFGATWRRRGQPEWLKQGV